MSNAVLAANTGATSASRLPSANNEMLMNFIVAN